MYPQAPSQYAQPAGYYPYYGTQPTYNPQADFQDGHGGLQMDCTPTAPGYCHPSTAAQAMIPQPLQLHIPAAPVGVFTRNLIGSLSASAFRLTDLDDNIGVWFILQDLSIRTEGSFRYVRSPILFTSSNIHGENKPEPHGAKISLKALNHLQKPLLSFSC